MQTCRLALADGTLFIGTAFGAAGTRFGEVCFNTSLTGYAEIITDPSYRGQIVTLTYPLIGNYGVTDEDFESGSPQIEGLVIRELSPVVSNYRARMSLSDWLASAGVIGISDVDTRAITRKLRDGGWQMAAISTEQIDDAELIQRARTAPSLVGRDLVQEVAAQEPFKWREGFIEPFGSRPDAFNSSPDPSAVQPKPSRRRHVVALDAGMKRNILRNLVESGCDVTVLPPTASAGEILAHRPDGVFLSNGPGDPEPLHYLQNTTRELIGQVPLFGICLGQQILGLAMGAPTYKLKFGHRGGNQPVQNLGTGRVEITSQNHGFAVDLEKLKQVGGEPTHINLNDGTLEGFRHTSAPAFAVQYHPEAAPGPHDATYLFDCFMNMMDTGRSPTAEDMAAAQKKLEDPRG